MHIQNFRYYFLEGFKYFLISHKLKIYVNVDQNSNNFGIFLQRNLNPTNNFDKNRTILDWFSVEKFLTIDESNDIQDNQKIKYLKSKLDMGYFNFFDIQFEFELDKLFFSYLTNNLPIEYLNQFITLIQKYGDDKFITFNNSEFENERFWILFEKLKPTINNTHLLEIYGVIKKLLDNKSETIENIDNIIYPFLQSRADLFEKETEQVSMFNAVLNILGEPLSLKYKNLLSLSVQESINKPIFAIFNEAQISCIEIDYYSFYSQIQMYPLGGYGHTIYQKMIEKILQEIVSINNLIFFKFDLINSDTKSLKVYLYSHNNNFDKHTILQIITKSAQYISQEYKNKECNPNDVDLKSFIMFHLLKNKLISQNKNYQKIIKV